MSFNIYHIYGAGLNLKDVDPELYRSFIMRHPDSLKKNWAEWRKRYDADEFVAAIREEDPKDWDCDWTENGTFSLPVADIISEETGIRFDSVGIDDDDNDCVLFVPAMPWAYNETERALQLEDLHKALEPYAEELGVEIDDELGTTFSG